MKRFGLVAVVATCITASVFAAQALAGTVVVAPGQMDGWTSFVDSTGGGVSFVSGPATPPLGSGSAELFTGAGAGDGSAELQNSGYNGVKVADLTQLSYWTYDVTNNGQQFPYLDLAVNLSGTGSTQDDYLVFEPPYQAPGHGNASCATQANTAMNTWQQWDALNGCWWDTAGTYGGYGGVYHTGPLSTFLAAHPNATIVNDNTAGYQGILLLVGYASAANNFDGYVDGLTIGVSGSNTTYDFEATIPPPTSKDQCKNGGWQSFTNPAFKNQGDCVSYVATGGKNGGNG